MLSRVDRHCEARLPCSAASRFGRISAHCVFLPSFGFRSCWTHWARGTGDASLSSPADVRMLAAALSSWCQACARALCQRDRRRDLSAWPFTCQLFSHAFVSTGLRDFLIPRWQPMGCEACWWRRGAVNALRPAGSMRGPPGGAVRGSAGTLGGPCCGSAPCISSPIGHIGVGGMRSACRHPASVLSCLSCSPLPLSTNERRFACAALRWAAYFKASTCKASTAHRRGGIRLSLLLFFVLSREAALGLVASSFHKSVLRS